MKSPKLIQICLCFVIIGYIHASNLGSFDMLSLLTSPFGSSADGFTLQQSQVAWRVVDSDTLTVEIPGTFPVNSVMPTTRCDVYYEGNKLPTTTTAVGNSINIRITDSMYEKHIQTGMEKNLQVVCRDAFNKPISASQMNQLKLSLQKSDGTFTSTQYVRSNSSPLFNSATRSVSHSGGTAGSTGNLRWSIMGITGAVPKGSMLEQVIPASWSFPKTLLCTINNVAVSPLISLQSGGARLISTVIPEQFTDSTTGALDLVCKDVKVPSVITDLVGSQTDIQKQVFKFPDGRIVSDIPALVTEIGSVVTLGANNNKNIITNATMTSTLTEMSISMVSSGPMSIIPGLKFQIELPYDGLLELGAEPNCKLTISPTAAADLLLLAADLSLALISPNVLEATVDTLVDNKDAIIGILRQLECSPVLTSRFTHPQIGEISITAVYQNNVIGIGTGYTLSPIAQLTGLTGDIMFFPSMDKLGDLVSLLIRIPTNGVKAGDVIELLQPTGSWSIFNSVGYFFGGSECGIITEYDQNKFSFSDVSVEDFIPGIDVSAENNALIFRFPSDIATVGLGVYCDFASNPISDFFTTAVKIPGALYNVWDKYVRPIVETVATVAFDALKGLFGRIANVRTVVQNSQSGSIAQLDMTLLQISPVSPNSADTGLITLPVFAETSYVLIQVPPGYSFGADSVCNVSYLGDTISEVTTVIPFSTMKSQTVKTKQIGDTHSGNFNIQGAAGMGRTVQVKVNAPGVPLTDSKIDCSHFLMPNYATDASSAMDVRVYNKDTSNRGWKLVGYSAEVGLPATDPAGISDAILSINSRTPGQITSVTLGIKALSNDIPVGSSLHMMLPPSVILYDDEPRCILQSGSNIIKGNTAVYMSTPEIRRTVRGLKGYSVSTDGASYQVQTASHSRTVTMANFAEESKVMTPKNSNGNEQAQTIKFTPSTAIPAKTTLTLVCGNLRMNPATSPSKYVDGTTMVWSQRPDAAIDVAVARVAYISTYQDSQTHTVVGNAALLHTIVVSGSTPVPSNVLHLLEATYAEFLGHIGVTVTLMRQYVTYQFAIDSLMLTPENVRSMHTFQSIDPAQQEQLDPHEEAFSTERTETTFTTPAARENTSRAADKDKVQLLTTRIIASNPSEELSVLMSNVHQASTLLSIGNSFAGITGRSIVKMYTAQPFPWATYIDKCMDPSICGGTEQICQQCYSGQQCSASIDCYSNSCSFGMCDGQFTESVNSGFTTGTVTSVVTGSVMIGLAHYFFTHRPLQPVA